ncbi:MAG: DnaD domain protein [Chloroflexi bacterium]|nr:DnaD domain protein [Chloroflexota bacterium]
MSDIGSAAWRHNFDSDEAITLPADFLTRLLPEIDDLAELKVTVFFLAALRQKEGKYRYMRAEEFRADADLMRGLATVDRSSSPAQNLEDALRKALARGTLLRAEIDLDDETCQLYFRNDQAGRDAQRRVEAGEWRPAYADEIEILPPRPTLFGLYEENIGILTPMIAEAIKAAQAEYPHEWIEDAMRYAVERNARNWRYIQRVLQGWQQEGRSRETSGRHHGGPRKYTTGKRKNFIKS